MELQDQAEEAFQDVKDNAEDVRHEAKLKTKNEVFNVEVGKSKNNIIDIIFYRVLLINDYFPIKNLLFL
ncbi:hypothetical protein [Methanobrevibacter arboriphilus]|uniref:hypothetical protein n=1 Tax=Methanobrevibacter arboriphilus TaxID=39441 RepID=UPI0006944148|nr:hypothetical protein [Methanobrevibacter arboriphilus]